MKANEFSPIDSNILSSVESKIQDFLVDVGNLDIQFLFYSDVGKTFEDKWKIVSLTPALRKELLKSAISNILRFGNDSHFVQFSFDANNNDTAGVLLKSDLESIAKFDVAIPDHTYGEKFAWNDDYIDHLRQSVIRVYSKDREIILVKKLTKAILANKNKLAALLTVGRDEFDFAEKVLLLDASFDFIFIEEYAVINKLQSFEALTGLTQATQAALKAGLEFLTKERKISVPDEAALAEKISKKPLFMRKIARAQSDNTLQDLDIPRLKSLIENSELVNGISYEEKDGYLHIIVDHQNAAQIRGYVYAITDSIVEGKSTGRERAAMSFEGA